MLSYISYAFLQISSVVDPFQHSVSIVLSSDEYSVLIVESPRWSLATYFDSGNFDVKKDYTRIKGVLDEALDGYAQKGGQFQNKGERLTEDNRHLLAWDRVPLHQAEVSQHDGFMSSITLKGLSEMQRKQGGHLVSKIGANVQGKSPILNLEKTSVASRYSYRKSFWKT